MIVWPRVCNRRFGTHQESIMVPVIRAFNLDNFVTANMRSCHAQGIHGRFCAGIAKTYLLDWCKAAGHFFSQENRVWTRQRVKAALPKLISQRLYQDRMRMANQETAKTEMKVCVFVAIVVPDMAALCTTDEQRVWRYSLK